MLRLKREADHDEVVAANDDNLLREPKRVATPLRDSHAASPPLGAHASPSPGARIPPPGAYASRRQLGTTGSSSGSGGELAPLR